MSGGSHFEIIPEEEFKHWPELLKGTLSVKSKQGDFNYKSHFMQSNKVSVLQDSEIKQRRKVLNSKVQLETNNQSKI